MPAIHPLNREAWEVYQLASKQVIVGGMGDVIDMDFKGLDLAMEMIDVPRNRRRDVFTRALSLGRMIQELSVAKKQNGINNV